MKLFHFLFKDSKATILFATLSGILSGAATTLLLGVIHESINSERTVVPRDLVLRFVVLAALFFVFTLGSHIPLLHISEGAVKRLRVHLTESILKARYQYLETLGSHRLFASLTTDVDRIAFGLSVIPAIMISVVVLLGCFAYLGFLSWKALVALVLFMAFAISVFVRANGAAMKKLSRARDVGDELFAHFRAVAEGTKELKLNSERRRDFLDKLLLPDSERFKKDRIAGLSGLETANAIANLGYFVVIGFLIFLLPYWDIVDTRALSGAVLIFVFMLAPLTTLGNHFNSFAEAAVALRKIEALGLSLGEHEAVEGKVGHPAEDARPVVTMEQVAYTYNGQAAEDRFTLGPIDLHIEPGEVLYVTGGNGSGKSTLGKLIVGLYHPDEGGLRLDEEVIDDANREWYRQHFSAVFSDFFIFDRILGVAEGSLDSKAREYLSELQLLEKVRIEDGVLSTTKLSSGQRRRLALLVAYLEDRPIYLFDEWAADQDPQFKEIFYSRVLPDLKRRGKAVVVITHDDRYFHLADRLLKLEAGELVS